LKERLLVLAKAYPITSRKYEHLVCVAGITEEGEWRRIYPVPWNVFWSEDERKFKKKQWIEYELKSRNPSDHRPESRKIKPETLKPLHEESFKNIKKILDERHVTLDELQSKSHKEVSLGVIKPIILDFIWQKSGYYERIRNMEKQKTLTGESAVNIETPDKIFQYVFKCAESCEKIHKIICEDWELAELYRKVKKKSQTDEEAVKIVRYKFLNYMKSLKHLYFIMGTHNVYGTWLIISVIYPKKDDLKQISQSSLNDFLA